MIRSGSNSIVFCNNDIIVKALMKNGVEKQEAVDGGIDNVSDMWFNGLATAVDSLMAVYEPVYEKKLTTLNELKTALECNWKGYEHLQRLAKRCKHKYGVNDEVADYYANALHTFFCVCFE